MSLDSWIWKKRWAEKDKWDKKINKKIKNLENGNKKVKSVGLETMNQMCVVISNKCY